MRFHGLTAISGLDLQLTPNTVTGLIGPNGAGKTTLFNCICRVYKPTTGTMFLGDLNLLRLAPHQVQINGIGRTFQHARLFKRLTVAENVALGYLGHYRTSPLSEILRLPSAAREEGRVQSVVDEVLRTLGILELRDHMVIHLPFGIQKLVDFGRALVCNPQLLLLDEPVSGSTSEERGRVRDLIRRISAAGGITILVVEHDVQFVSETCQYAVALNYGAKLTEGTTQAVISHPAVRKAYLGDDSDDNSQGA